MSNKVYEKVLSAWAKETRASFSPEVRKAINLASYDLHFGPPCASDCADPPTDEHGNENEWSGFSFDKACKTIKEALKDVVPNTLYVNTDSEYYSEDMPCDIECPVCEGSKIDSDEDTECTNCAGTGSIQDNEGWYQVERKDLIKAILGKELANYV
jgi:hypothetical protein